MMKYLIISITLILCISGKAQEFQSAIHFGLCPAQVDGDGLGGYNKISLYGGGGIQVPFKNGFIRTSILYTRRGSRNKLSGQVFQFNYLDFVPMYTYPLYDKLELGGGIYIGKTLTAKVGYSGNFNDISAQFYPFDYGWHLGGSYELTEALSLEANFNRSFFKVSFGGLYNNYIKIGLLAKLTSR